MRWLGLSVRVHTPPCALCYIATESRNEKHKYLDALRTCLLITGIPHIHRSWPIPLSSLVFFVFLVFFKNIYCSLWKRNGFYNILYLFYHIQVVVRYKNFLEPLYFLKNIKQKEKNYNQDTLKNNVKHYRCKYAEFNVICLFHLRFRRELEKSMTFIVMSI